MTIVEHVKNHIKSIPAEPYGFNVHEIIYAFNKIKDLPKYKYGCGDDECPGCEDCDKLEEVDFENIEFLSITDDEIEMTACGDWQKETYLKLKFDGVSLNCIDSRLVDEFEAQVMYDNCMSDEELEEMFTL